MLGKVLEARILGGFGSQRVHQALHLPDACSVIVLPWTWYTCVHLLVLLDIDLLEVVSGESEREGSRLSLLIEGRLESVAVRGGTRESCGI